MNDVSVENRDVDFGLTFQERTLQFIYRAYVAHDLVTFELVCMNLPSRIRNLLIQSEAAFGCISLSSLNGVSVENGQVDFGFWLY